MQSQKFIFDNEIEWEVIDEHVRRKILGYDDRIMMVKVEFKTGGVGAVHDHPHTQVTHVESGAFELTMGDETKLLKTGDAFFVPPNTPHGVVCKEAGVLIDSFSPIREDFL
ncbi:cupin domain-containing protein [Reichenbachiella ulvae]|uniref:Cupin domain-containing protein n=1 Tax=Reichenbachiella ulvae TaxID=2980104 RepID=A0ABT3CW25_9BACT|nr:cupin domain-containing protein [Reichenbachiella ulvae]MCV9387802.1 cupin domain-containing protein [Reichenbachiella ulvae]